jgi:hypothetical protein
MRRITIAIAGVAVVAAATLTTPGTTVVADAAPSPGSQTAHTAQTATPTRAVTLPTGDRVLVSTSHGKPEYRLQAGTSSHRAATVLTAAGHTYVVPAAASGLVGHGLSLSLFDVTALAAAPASRSPLVLRAAFGPTYQALPAGLTRTSSTTVAVSNPRAFGAAVASAWLTQKHGGTPGLLTGLRLSLPSSPATDDGRLTASPGGRLFTVKIKGIDRQGHPASGDIGVLNNVDDTSRFIAGQSFYHGTFSFSVPRGHYSVQSYLSTLGRKGVSYTLATDPQFLVDRDLTVTLDARDGIRFSAATPRPSTPVHAELNLQREPRTGLSFTDSFSTFDATPLYATPTEQVTVGKLYFYPAARLGDRTGSLSRYLYDLEFPFRKAVPSDLSFDVTADQLATVDTTFASVVPDRVEQESRIGALPYQTSLVGAVNNVTAPSSRIEYVTAKPGLLWHQEVDLDPDNGNGRTLASSAIYRSGQVVHSTWNDQPSGSGVEQERDAGQACPVCRTGDTLSVTVFPNVDAQNDFMLADATTTENVSLYQDGDLVGSSRSGFASFPLSPDPAAYRLQYDVDRTASWWPTSTHVSTAWSFESQERPPTQLPPGWTCGGKALRADECSMESLLLPHYVTPAGPDGVIPAGSVAHVLVRVTPQRGLDPDPLTSVTGQVSYDGGTTWQDVRAVRRSDTSYRLSYHQPELAQTDGFASLHITGVATSGSSVEQTVVHAYPLAPLEATSTATPALGCAVPAQAPTTQCLSALSPTPNQDGADPVGYTPADIRQAYALPRHGSQATVAVVTPYDAPTAVADLAVYREEFGLPKCTVGSGCFTKVNQQGQAAPLPEPQPDWAVQTAQALDAVSATCPRCKILLVEANSSSLTDLVPAALTAGRLGADVISNGYGTTGEFSGEQQYEKSYRTLKVPFVVAAADYGYGNGAPLIGSISYPSASRFAVAVGGTTLTPSANDRGFTETVWANTTSGCSAYIAKPTWQHDRLCGKRTTADVAAVADPATGLAVYDTFGYDGWVEVGGTSLATAVVAGIYGLNGQPGSTRPAADLYAAGASVFDVTEGANGECKGSYLCTARVAYDGPSGVGTPNGDTAF